MCWGWRRSFRKCRTRLEQGDTCARADYHFVSLNTALFGSWRCKAFDGYGVMTVTHSEHADSPQAPPRTSSRRESKTNNPSANGTNTRTSISKHQVNSFHPVADSQTFRDLLIFEERLKQNAARLVKRKKKYQSAYSKPNASRILPVPQLSWCYSAEQ